VKVYLNGSNVDNIHMNGYGAPYTPNPNGIYCVIVVLGGTTALGLAASGVGGFWAAAPVRATTWALPKCVA
jgi:hypothetical protein